MRNMHIMAEAIARSTPGTVPGAVLSRSLSRSRRLRLTSMHKVDPSDVLSRVLSRARIRRNSPA
jgi:hypothetical protein